MASDGHLGYDGPMPWFRTITHSRKAGHLPTGREVGRATFEAEDNTAAIAETQVRARLLPKHHFLALFELDGKQIDSVERPDS
ncbi:MAG TPA: hypothetical protein VIJ59_01295 [Caulobacteraceae bacterium]